MEIFEFILELFGGLILFIGFGCVIGHFLKLDNFSNDREKSIQLHMRETDISKKEPDEFKQDNDKENCISR